MVIGAIAAAVGGKDRTADTAIVVGLGDDHDRDPVLLLGDQRREVDTRQRI